MRARIAGGPSFRYPRPDEGLLSELVAGYEHLTADPVARAPKRNLIAACYRVHGDAFLPLVARLFARNGTVTNLLGEIRSLPPRDLDDEIQDTVLEVGGPASAELAPGLTYSAGDPPPFDPTSTRRYDRRRSNPDAAGLFDDLEDEVTASPTARALAR